MLLRPRDADQLSVMSFNLRYPALDGQPWRRRLPQAAAVIRQERPHLIGTQEGMLRQLTGLIDALPDHYQWLGEGREGGDAGEFTAVIYDSRRLEITHQEVSWLSERPHVPGSKSWGARYPRTMTVVDAVDTRTRAPLRFINVHLDHRSDHAQVNSAALILEKIREAGTESVLIGDFNAYKDRAVYRTLMDSGLLTDAVVSCPSETCEINTFHGYRGPRRDGQHMDWILHTAGLRTCATGVNIFGRGVQYPSDHFPLQALIEHCG
ncbi:MULTISPECIES: endonuclease/exonuclease/phosphatase family protein [Brevibacterium]|uniref:Endonuclease/exonuclease/phosphatase n=2 Tax=Brevibacterium luteolum TaxID=199591 RepID=A0A2N6PL09_9MICO|nr:MULTISPECIES: endonuclease/exonuclease/phosphatase family protein [Brevibacterium]MBM7528506.1 endonuclease/exonuclease/phosphatase family metal-dependent hydrolase [Brevibacterium luteolum]MCT1657284.1 endonuclease/exonuclease/phosphatase family protein [Brevibacterium luteolum]MCT1828502.1 endonuclease/exonuclease/phosphatase family protein [Brevibacterium luteolum]NNG79289.1 endonuclease/exonuclease/phosphatase family protein [Brevibacterium luteolum]PMB99382.1 endonuclease/exonuclease/p